MSEDLLPGFTSQRIAADGVDIHVRVAGEGRPVLLLHGYPQTHLIWHRVAPALVEAGHTVVLSDLRGYGDSAKPASEAPAHATYSKRAMAHDQWLVMRELGFERFAAAGSATGWPWTGRRRCPPWPCWTSCPPATPSGTPTRTSRSAITTGSSWPRATASPST